MPSAAQRLLKSAENYTLAVCEEAEDRDVKHVRGIREYLTVRRGSTASEVIFLLALLHLEISDEAMEHPTVRKLTELGSDLICIHNVSLSSHQNEDKWTDIFEGYLFI